RHTRLVSDWSSDVCSSDLEGAVPPTSHHHERRVPGDLHGPDDVRVTIVVGVRNGHGIDVDESVMSRRTESSCAVAQMDEQTRTRSEERRVGTEWWKCTRAE